MNILITGSHGFIGSHIAAQLARHPDYQIIGVTRQAPPVNGQPRFNQPNITVAIGDFTNPDFLSTQFQKRPIHCIIHCAAIRGVGKNSEHEYARVNVRGTENLLQLACQHQVKQFIFCSSVGVWGTIPPELPPRLTTPLNGDNAYHLSKIQAEEKVNAVRKRGLNAIIVRPGITYGAGDDGFPATLIRMVRSQRCLLPTPAPRIHLVAVTKLAELFELMVTQGLNLATPVVALDQRPISLEQLVDLIAIHFHSQPFPKYLKWPAKLFQWGAEISAWLNNEAWHTRFQLFSQDWYYEPTTFPATLKFQPADTEIEFKNYLNRLRLTV